MHVHNEVRKECFKLGISQQTFIRALIKDYFIRNHGVDLDLKRKERIGPPPPPAGQDSGLEGAFTMDDF